MQPDVNLNSMDVSVLVRFYVVWPLVSHFTSFQPSRWRMPLLGSRLPNMLCIEGNRYVLLFRAVFSFLVVLVVSSDLQI